MDPQVAMAGDVGQVFFQQYRESATARIMADIVAPLLARVGKP